MMNSQNKLRYKYSQQGLSLVEVLVSMTLMTVLIVAISTPLAGLFKYSKESKELVEANASARTSLETARSAWQTYHWADPSDPEVNTINQKIQQLNIDSLIRFNKNCAGPDVIDQMGPDVIFELFRLDRHNEVAQTLDASNFTSDCATVAEGPYMAAKRIQVKVIDANGKSHVAAHVDMRAPTTSIPTGNADDVTNEN